jgi:Rieske 2Fe-2S family protein
VPIYGRAIMEERDDPTLGRRHAGTAAIRAIRRGRRAAGCGDLVGGRQARAARPSPALTEAERKAGYLFVTGLPSLYVVAHVDYVRVVRLRPVGPDRDGAGSGMAVPRGGARRRPRSRIIANIGGSSATLVMAAGRRRVRAEPGRGLGAIAGTSSGVLMPEEYAILDSSTTGSGESWRGPELAPELHRAAP